MAESFQGPVQVNQDGRYTIVDGNELFVGRRARPPGEMIDLENADITTEETAPAPRVRLVVGDTGAAGSLSIVDDQDSPVILLDNGFARFGTGHKAGGITIRGARNGPVISVSGEDGRITFRNSGLDRTLVIDGETGDIVFGGADCAEDFEVVGDPAPGSVMCLVDDGSLNCCSISYDKRVAGVISGAGEWQPALRLDHHGNRPRRAPIALVGKVYCLADADFEPIHVGDLLTTSSTEGHARRATNAAQSFGAVLGKSLSSLSAGRGLIPVLVALQ